MEKWEKMTSEEKKWRRNGKREEYVAGGSTTSMHARDY